MCGRQERDKVIELKTNEYIKDTHYLIQRYIKSIDKKQKTSYTRYIYATYLVAFYKYLQSENIELINVKPMDIDDYINYISIDKYGNENGCQIINARLSAIISFYNFLVENEVVNKNPCSNKKKLKVPEKTSVTYLTPNEVRKMIKFIKMGKGRYKKYINRDVAIIEIGCSIGLRVSAIVNIDIEDIDMNNNTIMVIEKGKRQREVYFGENTKQSLLTWIKERNEIMGNCTGALFITKNKTRMSRDAVSDMLKSAAKEANINKPITPHKMRSTCAMNLYLKKKDIYLVQEQLGHKNIKNTMIYARATEDQLRDAVDTLDLIY